MLMKVKYRFFENQIGRKDISYIPQKGAVDKIPLTMNVRNLHYYNKHDICCLDSKKIPNLRTD